MKINCIGKIISLYLGKIKKQEKILIVKNKYNNKYPFSKLKFFKEIKIPIEEKILTKAIGIIERG